MDIPAKLGIPDYEFRVVIGRTRIEYDNQKEDANRKKHGYSLESAVCILERLALPFGDQRPHAVTDPILENGEVRHNHMGVDERGEVVFMVTTIRPEETMRIISFRRAHVRERLIFEEVTGYVESNN